MEQCLACSLSDGTVDLPGGRIYATPHWVVEHCIGPLGVGTLIVKPLRHCLHVWDLTAEEAEELGPLLKLATEVMERLLEPDQVYICLWSHMGWQPVHIHFVLQPSWKAQHHQHERPGAFLQMEMFKSGELPSRQEVEAFAERARAELRR